MTTTPSQTQMFTLVTFGSNQQLPQSWWNAQTKHDTQRSAERAGLNCMPIAGTFGFVVVKEFGETSWVVVDDMIENKYGRIVNIASIAGKEGNPNASHYSAAKAGVIALTKSLGKELAQLGILVNCITPAVIETDILKQVTQQHIDYMLSKIPMGRFGKKEEAAAMAAWLCSEDCSFTTGSTFDLSGGRATY